MPSDDLFSSVETFLAYSMKLEEEAELRFGQLADAMEAGGNTKVAALFRKLSDYSRMHHKEAKARSGFRDVPVILPREFQWPDLESPETAEIWAADPLIAYEQALEIALASEKAGHAFYKSVLDNTTNPEIKALAKEFVIEESEHVAWLEQWISETKKGRTGAQAERAS
jgi:rubrerythrin